MCEHTCTYAQNTVSVLAEGTALPSSHWKLNARDRNVSGSFSRKQAKAAEVARAGLPPKDVTGAACTPLVNRYRHSMTANKQTSTLNHPFSQVLSHHIFQPMCTEQKHTKTPHGNKTKVNGVLLLVSQSSRARPSQHGPTDGAQNWGKPRGGQRCPRCPAPRGTRQGRVLCNPQVCRVFPLSRCPGLKRVKNL